MTTIVTFESIMDVCPVLYQVPFIIIAAIALITSKLQPLMLGSLVHSHPSCLVCLKGAKVTQEL